MENYQLSQENLNELRRAHKKTREKWLADRIKVVYLLGSGWAVGDVAQAVMVDENTVRSHFQAWKSCEIQGLEQRHNWGKVSRLTEVQKNELTKMAGRKSVLQGRGYLAAHSKDVRRKTFRSLHA